MSNPRRSRGPHFNFTHFISQSHLGQMNVSNVYVSAASSVLTLRLWRDQCVFQTTEQILVWWIIKTRYQFDLICPIDANISILDPTTLGVDL